MTNILPPPPQKILSNTASPAKDIVLEKQIVAYTWDNPKLTKLQNEQRRNIEAVMKKQVEL
jgi:hypothetical protein